MYALARMCVCRFHSRRRREAKARGEVESSDLNPAHNRKRKEIKAQLTKQSESKSSVLQSIYGKIIAFILGEVNMCVCVWVGAAVAALVCRQPTCCFQEPL